MVVPKDETDRQAREIRVYDLLEQLGIDFWRVDHDAARTMEDCAQADRLLGAGYGHLQEPAFFGIPKAVSIIF